MNGNPDFPLLIAHCPLVIGRRRLGVPKFVGFWAAPGYRLALIAYSLPLRDERSAA